MEKKLELESYFRFSDNWFTVKHFGKKHVVLMNVIVHGEKVPPLFNITIGALVCKLLVF